MEKLMLIVNPNSGRSAYSTNFGEAMQLLSRKYETTLFFTKKRGDAAIISKSRASDFDTVACIGGDGTLSEVLSGLMQLDNPPPVGYIPTGTANDIATTLGLSKNDTIGAAKQILDGEPHPFDIGGFGADKYFAYIAAFGAFTNVSYETPQNQKRALGHLAYVLQGAAQLPYLETYKTRVEYDDGVIEGNLVYGSMSNSTSVAGIVKLKEEMVSLGDGMSELVLVKYPGSIEAFGELAASVFSRSFEDKNLIILHTKKAKFTFEKPVAWTRDGEDGGLHQEVELCNYHCPVQLIF